MHGKCRRCSQQALTSCPLPKCRRDVLSCSYAALADRSVTKLSFALPVWSAPRPYLDGREALDAKLVGEGLVAVFGAVVLGQRDALGLQLLRRRLPLRRQFLLAAVRKLDCVFRCGNTGNTGQFDGVAGAVHSTSRSLGWVGRRCICINRDAAGKSQLDTIIALHHAPKHGAACR